MTMTTQQLDKLIQESDAALMSLSRKGIIIGPAVDKIKARRAALLEELNTRRRREAETLGEIIGPDPAARNDINRRLLKLLLFIDVLYDHTTSLMSTLDRLGVGDISLAADVRQIKGIAARIVRNSIDRTGNPELDRALQGGFALDDDTIRDINILADRFIKTRFIYDK